MKNLSKCGVCCSTDCKAYKIESAMKKGFPSCKECGKAPCELWLATRDPELSDEEFQADIDSRLKNFKKQD